jgi:uncharacterized membrane protein (TIGR02234 family)
MYSWDAMTDPRRTFGPVVLLGLASAGLAAVAGNRPWAGWSAQSRSESSLLSLTGGDTATVPLAGALALVLLACWGVLLVTRGRVRRAIAVLGLVVSAVMVATAVLGYRSATSGLRSDLAEAGVEDPSVQSVAWYWVFLACALVSVAATAAAVRLVPAWPEMGSRYDAPGATATRRDETDLDLWKALDDGRDPTLTDPPAPDP